jgi:hypothetical protein
MISVFSANSGVALHEVTGHGLWVAAAMRTACAACRGAARLLALVDLQERRQTLALPLPAGIDVLAFDTGLAGSTRLRRTGPSPCSAWRATVPSRSWGSWAPTRARCRWMLPPTGCTFRSRTSAGGPCCASCSQRVQRPPSEQDLERLALARGARPVVYPDEPEMRRNTLAALERPCGRSSMARYGAEVGQNDPWHRGARLARWNARSLP